MPEPGRIMGFSVPSMGLVLIEDCVDRPDFPIGVRPEYKCPARYALIEGLYCGLGRLSARKFGSLTF